MFHHVDFEYDLLLFLIEVEWKDFTIFLDGDFGGCGARRFFRPLRVIERPSTLPAWLTVST